MALITMMIRLTATLVIAASLTIAGCGRIPTPGVYKLDIQQGNVVDAEMLAKLEPGMEKRKVRFILGTPMVTHTFDPDRWDYLYSFKEGGGVRVQRHIVLLFEQDRLVEVVGDVTPGAIESTEVSTKEQAEERVVSVPDQPPEGILTGLSTLLDDDDTRVPRTEKAEKPLVVKTSNASGTSTAIAEEAPESVVADDEVETDVAQFDEEDEYSEFEVTVEDNEVTLEEDNDGEEESFFGRLTNKFDLSPPAQATQNRD